MLLFPHDDDSHLSAFCHFFFFFFTKNAKPWQDSGHSDCDCHLCKGCVFSLYVSVACVRFSAAFELFLLLGRGGCCRLGCLGTWSGFQLCFFGGEEFRKRGKRQQKLGIESYEVEGKLLTDLNPSSAVVFFVMFCLYRPLPGLSRMEDKIFRQQETKRHNCPVSTNMAENTPWPLGCCS